MPFFYSIDRYYIVLVIPAMLLSLWAQFQINSAYSKYSRVATLRGLTGAQAAEAVLRRNGVYDVHIGRISGNLTDHYDPQNKVIKLSDTVYDVASVAACGVAAHEAGHAVQHAVGYAPIRIRNAIVPVANLGSSLSIPLIIIGLVLNAGRLITLGILCMAAATVFQLVTLPVELNASRRALESLEDGGLLYEDEIPGASRVLRAAAMTYVAALALSMAQLLRFTLLFSGRRDRR